MTIVPSNIYECRSGKCKHIVSYELIFCIIILPLFYETSNILPY